jgi:hypothetical protein
LATLALLRLLNCSNLSRDYFRRLHKTGILVEFSTSMREGAVSHKPAEVGNHLAGVGASAEQPSFRALVECVAGFGDVKKFAVPTVAPPRNV